MTTFRSASLFPFSLCLLSFACSPPADNPAGVGGTVNTGGLLGSGGETSSAGGGFSSGGGVANTGGQTTGGSSTGGTSAGGSGAGTSTGAQTNSGGSSAGGTPGVGGTPATGGQLGSGGSSSGGSGTGSTTGDGGNGGSTGGGGNADPCPSDATFCSGFDDAELPNGAVFKLNGDPATPWTTYFEVDSSVMNSGASSLRVRSLSEASGAYKMLAVPSGGATFWARFYIRSDVVLGEMDHNVFAQASGSDDPNDGTSVEFAEDVGIAFNSSDSVRWPEGYGRLSTSTNPYTLEANVWHCIELFFDGAGQSQQLFVNGEELINASGFPDAAKSFSVLKFGYNALHGTERQLWYDDVAVGPTRPGCL